MSSPTKRFVRESATSIISSRTQCLRHYALSATCSWNHSVHKVMPCQQQVRKPKGFARQGYINNKLAEHIARKTLPHQQRVHETTPCQQLFGEPIGFTKQSRHCQVCDSLSLQSKYLRPCVMHIVIMTLHDSYEGWASQTFK